MTSDAKVVAFAGAIREKPANKMIIQSSRTAKKGMGMELPRWEKSTKRACIRSLVTCTILSLQAALHIIGGLQVLNLLIEGLALRCSLKRPCLS